MSHRSSTAVERPLSALDAIFARRSVRSFTPRVIDKPTVRALLDAAVQAPTAMHAEPWAFVVVQDLAALRRISDRAKALWAGSEAAHYRYLPMLAAAATERPEPESIFHDASTLIVICARPLSPFVTADCWLAAENVMLAACALGLGSCCVGAALPALNDPDIRAMLHIPSDVEAVAPIVIGEAADDPTPAVRQEPRMLSWI